MEITQEIYDICIKHALKLTKGNRENAEDAVQRAFFYILHSKAEIHYKAGFTKAVENALYRDYVMRRNQIIRFVNIGPEYEQFITEPPPNESADFSFVYDAIEQTLTEKQKEVVKFYMNNDGSLTGHKENYNSFKSNFHLAKNKLKKILLDKYSDSCYF